ncbi:MAG: response regulator transcription factor [Planctomycetaceae bacterium]|jgi:DNA-binding response OmpR family regulator|nr:response regulator transcription factor [Planctomycetaceae bacterium]MBT4010873.1 response regulator transcription factor [Planctomycetaceae bacterium]MBT4725449.1 response regulator transcription factor [Planctomycetaceae bacterium]MBT4845216.1 response regulator transcription factor [Planctomycetaceae bacterium]MBT5125451.1 response regulator transcription factor [Planctomycetaceae bacterium]
MTASDQSTTGSSILVIDDNPDILNTVAFALKQAGYDVSTANNGEDGLSLAYDTKPALIVLDMMMPKRSGFLVIESLRKDYDKPIKIIMMTANEGERHESYAELLGVDEYLHKPFTMELLVQRVKELLC